MKHTSSLAIVISFLILFSFSNAKHKKEFPNAGNVVREYYIQNSVNNLIRNDLVKTPMEINPSRYIVLNGNDEAHDTTNAKAEAYDPVPYYPYYDASKHPFVPSSKKYEGMAHTPNSIYSKDKAPYYGPNTSTIIDSNPNKGIKVGVTMGDLTEITPSIANILEYEMELENLNRYIAGPKKMLSDQKFVDVYKSDPNAYYDPTNTDLHARKLHLEKIIADLKQRMKNEQSVDNVIAREVKIEKTPGTIRVQNKVNGDKEADNEYIANSFYYPVKRNNPIDSEVKAKEPEKRTEVKITPIKYSEKKSELRDISRIIKTNKNTNLRKTLDTQGLKYEKVKIISLRKN